MITVNYFCVCHKNRRKHNQHVQLLFLKINLHFVTSNQISTYRKLNLSLINGIYLFSFLSSRNAKKTRTDQSILHVFYSV